MIMSKHLIFLGCISFMLLGSVASAQQGNNAAQSDTAKKVANVSAQQDDGKIDIELGDTVYSVAYADEPIERQLGLMYRRKMCDDCGMLFRFDSVRTGSIWMKNTYIPLDLAYITEDGIIVDIKALTPHDETSVRSSKPVRFALEMNQGWFGKKNIKVGDKVGMLP